MVAWARQHRGEPRGLAGAELCRGHTEVVPGRRLRPEDTDAPFGHVEVDLQDATLVHRGFEHPGDEQLLGLAQVAALAGKEEVLRELHGDGGATEGDAAALRVALEGLLDRIPVDAVV